MSGLGSFYGLGLMGNALDTFQQATNVTSDNIANVNTPGASRQNVNITQMPAAASFGTTTPPGLFGNGTMLAEIQRIHDDSYDALFRGATASQNYATTQQTQLQALQAQLGEPSNGVSAAFTAFQSAISQLVNQAGSNATSSRANVLAAAQTLTQALNNASNAVSNQKNQAVSQAGTLVNKVNGILDQIASLNGQIRASTAAGDQPNAFMDQRDHLVDQLSTYLSTQTSVQKDGSVLVSVGGQALVNDSIAYHIAAPAVVTGANGIAQLQIGGKLPLGSGQLAALADLYNNKLSGYGQQLDNFASSMAGEVNRITGASYDQNGVAGGALFASGVASQPISAATITVAITTASQLPVALASTAAGSLVTNMNSANNMVDTSAAINNNGSLANPPAAAGIAGTLTVTVDGVAQTFNYDTNSTDGSVNSFINHFNAQHLGVSASFDAAGQRMVFTRDPANIDLVHRAAQQAAGSPTDPTFTITDSNNPATPGASLLGALGASGIQGATQDASNAFGSNDNSGANALLGLFSSNVGVPPVQAAVATAIAAPGIKTIALPAGITSIRPGDVLTIDAQPGGASPQENVVVSAVSINPVTGVESITATFAKAHAANFSVSSAQVQTLGQYYGGLVTQVGVDTQTAIAGAASQTALASNIDQQRQSIDGINLDEETQNLIKYQNAYQAAARTMNVLDSLLSTVINTLGTGH
ncbi:MAG TPA: flagellar basal body rod C-terminal domain-containing protein [Candidatus Baltobacteraceae bacterium]|nr:flagellar basal body rod C-terminal domain-containing protein [Candidatus Baltobacteraceae bacterium]